MKKTIILLIFCIFTIISLLTAVYFVLGTDDGEYDTDSDFPQSLSSIDNIYRYYYENLNDEEKQAYRCIENEIRNHPEKIRIPPISAAQMSVVFNALTYDNPSLLCMQSGSSIKTVGELCWYLPNYNWEKTECKQRCDELMDAIHEITSQIDENASDFEREKFLHDRLILRCEYVQGENCHSAYGAIVEGEATCMGYAKAMQLLLSSGGIKSYIITGKAKIPLSDAEGHAWNIVWIEEKPYHLDATWNDPKKDLKSANEIESGDDIDNIENKDDRNTILYNYFNLTDEEISKTHSDFVSDPNCIYTDANYFRYMGLYFEKNDEIIKKTIEEKFIEALENGLMNIEFKFSSMEVLEEVFEDIIVNQEIYPILTRIKYPENPYIRDDKIFYSIIDNYNILHLEMVEETENGQIEN